MKRAADAKLDHFFGGLPVRFHIRNDLHLARKAWHMIMGLVIAFLYMSGVSRGTAVVLLGFFLGLDLVLENLRLRSPAVNERILKFWAPFMRFHEIHQMSTVPHYLASVILAIAIFPKPVAVLSILYLACGDPIASLIGILYGHKGPRLAGGKTMIGTLAGICTCTLVSVVYLSSLSVPVFTLFAVSWLGGLAGGMAELLPLEVDDNFTIPVVSGFVLWFTFLMFGF